MTIKKHLSIIACISCLLLAINCYAGKYFYGGNLIHINAYLKSIINKPSWLLTLRDAESQRVFYYLYEFNNGNNEHWIALANSNAYIIVASTLKWGSYAMIHNFCHLQSTLVRKRSLFVTITGDLTPDPNSFKCRIQ